MNDLIRKEAAAKIAGICSKQIKLLIEGDGFPKPVRVLRADRWVTSEVRAWVDRKIVERDDGVAGVSQ